MTLSQSFIIIPFIIDSKLAWIFQDKYLIDYLENKRSLGVLRLAHCPPLITVTRDVDKKKCHFLWRRTHQAHGGIGVGAVGVKWPWRRAAHSRPLPGFWGVETCVLVSECGLDCFMALCRGLLPGKCAVFPWMLIPHCQETLSLLNNFHICGYVNQAGLPLRKDQCLQGT